MDTDDYSHHTDLNWVSPGAPNDDVNGAFVPTDCGSPNGGDQDPTNTRCDNGTSQPGSGNGFEVDLLLDTPGIAQEALSVGGARYLYLDVTSQWGSSENGFEIYAGPPPAAGSEESTIPSNGNLRNVWIANQRADGGYYRDSGGVAVYAMGNLPMNASTTLDADIPLLYIPASYAGRNVTISLFDADSSTTGPATFYFDTLSQADYANVQEFGCSNVQGAADFCGNRWIGPPGNDYPGFVLTIPQYDRDQCTNAADPSQRDVCTPFYGGNLMVNYAAGKYDSYVWRVSLPSLPYLER